MTFDPVGGGSLDLKECLLAQMDYLQIKDETARAIVTWHRALLEKSDYVQLARVLDGPLSAVKYQRRDHQGPRPRPGPEVQRRAVVLRRAGHRRQQRGRRVEDHSQRRGPAAAADQRLLPPAPGQGRQRRARRLPLPQGQLKKAIWFLRSLDQSDQTIYKVARFIVDQQKDFFEKGIDFIRPLTLMEIAQDIGVHESTVGRVVANKYMMTPRGVFSLKYFFHKSLQGSYGEDVSSLKVKDKLRKLVEGRTGTTR